jgi:hypothetical protein
MRFLTNISKFIIGSLIQIAAAVALFLVFGAAALLAVPVLAISWLLIYACKLLINQSKIIEYELKDAIAALHIMEWRINLGSNFIKSIDRAINALPEREFKRFLNKVYARSVNGQHPQSAITASLKELKSNEVKDAMLGIANAYLNSGKVQSAIRNSIVKLENTREIKQAYHSASVSRYSMAIMVSGAILPSISIFAFIGYSLLYYSASMLIIFSTFLLTVIPSVYSVLNLKLVSLYAY